jgi:CDGSH-type Zn-finger protein
MAMIKVRQNGPYLVDVSEDVKVVDWNGQEYEITKRPFALCRCGASAKKPFCDGTHKTVGFQGAEAAGPVPEATDEAAR